MGDPEVLRARLTASLEDVAAALQAGDMEAAGRASERVVAACESSAAAGIVLSAEERKAAQHLLERCNALAGTVQAELHARLLAAGASARARKGYDSSA